MSSKTTKISLCPVGNGKIEQIFKIIKPKTLLTEYHKTACHLLFISNYICTGNVLCEKIHKMFVPTKNYLQKHSK